MLLYDRKRAFLARWIYLGAFVTIIFVVLTRIEAVTEVVRSKETLPQGWTLRFVEESLTGDSMLFYLPVICTFPYASSFVDEFKSGITRFTLTRVSWRKYLWSKVWTVSLSGGGILVIGALAVMIAFNVVFLPLEEGGSMSALTAKIIGNYIQLALRYFCLGALGSTVGLWISALINNRYMSFMAPFMAEYLLIIFYERYFSWCRILYPKEWLSPSDHWPGDSWGVLLWLLCMTLFLGWEFVETGKRRLDRA